MLLLKAIKNVVVKRAHVEYGTLANGYAAVLMLGLFVLVPICTISLTFNVPADIAIQIYYLLIFIFALIFLIYCWIKSFIEDIKSEYNKEKTND